MSAPLLLDVTRAVMRRLADKTPSGIDRVCDAYAAHFRDTALAVVQLRGRPLVLGDRASKRLFAALQGESGLVAQLVRLPLSLAPSGQIRGATYLNVGHTSFDRPSHWRWLARHRLNPVYMLHDLIPITHPQLTTPHKTARHRGRVETALGMARGVIANSKATADELMRFAIGHGLESPPVLTAPIGCAALPTPMRRTESQVPHFIAIGTIERRKNLGLLLDVWSRLAGLLGPDTPHLSIVGSDGLGAREFYRKLRRTPGLAQSVAIRTGLGDAALGELVGKARAVLMPTLAEGFGLPLVEALQMRVPVIASDLPSLGEIGQGIPTFLAPNDQAGWTSAILDHCAQGPDWQRQHDMLGRFAAPTWQDHFARVDPWLAQLGPSAANSFAPFAESSYRDHFAMQAQVGKQGRDASC